MNRKFLVSICLIFVAIGVGCVSAADVNNDTLTEKSTLAVEQHNVNHLQNQSEKIDTELVKEDKNSKINNLTENISSSQTDDMRDTKETHEIINNNSSAMEPQKSETQLNDDEEIYPANGYTVEQIKKNKRIEQF